MSRLIGRNCLLLRRFLIDLDCHEFLELLLLLRFLMDYLEYILIFVLSLGENLLCVGIILVFCVIILDARLKALPARLPRIIITRDVVSAILDAQLAAAIHRSLLRPPEADLLRVGKGLKVHAVPVRLAIQRGTMVDGISAPLIFVRKPITIL